MCSERPIHCLISSHPPAGQTRLSLKPSIQHLLPQAADSFVLPSLSLRISPLPATSCPICPPQHPPPSSSSLTHFTVRLRVSNRPSHSAFVSILAGLPACTFPSFTILPSLFISCAPPPFIPSSNYAVFFLGKVKIVYRKMINALGRKGRSRSRKRDIKSNRSLKSDTPPRLSMQSSPPPQEPFVNHGLDKWNKDRLAWTATGPDYVPKRPPPSSPQNQLADAQELYNALLRDQYHPLPRSVPLGEFIGILQHIREESL
ncbi:unnamed protein product [Chondrus crispus]|uniref:Uncharacterized protein n=1 Tax=Chondrus crispus TaxID=2769 RepID=R7QQS0_CHOCR|nr:unnamed protein product [Chondrus crispus]CDF40842.1 unnamed protein product [Chondrus crispus]|eukprot:XP_005711136.1 unnamed protein product [Chondrus crispus]